MSEEEVSEPKEPTELEKWSKRFDWGLVREYREKIARVDTWHGIKVKQHPPGPGTAEGWMSNKGPFNNPDRK